MAIGSISRQEPGVVLFLIDQSLSMSDPVAGDPNKPRSEAAAAAVNRAIFELISQCMKGEKLPRHYFDVGVIGYGDEVKSAMGGPNVLLPLPEVAVNPVGTNSDGSPMFVAPNHEGRYTRMSTAFNLAGSTLGHWVDKHPTSFPPIVINVSDGMNNEPNSATEKPEVWAERLSMLCTDHGSLVFFNIALADPTRSAGNVVLFPADATEIDDDYGKFLFDISSPLHPLMIEYAGMRQINATPGSKAFAFNAGLDELPKLLDIGTRAIPAV